MTNHNDQLKGMLHGIIAANPNHATDDRQAGRRDTAEYVLAAITLLEGGVVTSLGFERFIPEPACEHKDKWVARNGLKCANPECGQVFTLESVGLAEPDDEDTYVVRVGIYSYLAEPSEVGHIRVGDHVDIPSKNGGHWQGEVTEIQTAEDYEDTEGELPSLKIIGVLS